VPLLSAHTPFISYQNYLYYHQYEQTGEQWQYARVNQIDFDTRKLKTLQAAVEKSAAVKKALF
jgi:hypothetical protein